VFGQQLEVDGSVSDLNHLGRSLEIWTAVNETRQAPLPSMLILISRAASTLMKSVDVNWLP
jgi:hypothetical protein